MAAQPSVDPATLLAVSERLARAREEAFALSGELLDHYVETGDTLTQHAVDQLVEQAADTLRALTDSFGESTRALREAAARYTAAERSATPDEGAP
ncbi:MAG: hypothetical protein ACXVYY_05555 [Oryzihumus sp.]